MDDVRTTFRCIRGLDPMDSTTVELSDKRADGGEDFILDVSRLRVGIPREYRQVLMLSWRLISYSLGRQVSDLVGLS